MKIKIFFLALFSILFLRCSSDTVTVKSFSPQGKIEQLSNFTIEFSHDLAPAGLIDKWVDTEFITFTPAIKGKFKWVNPSTLVFSAETPLTPIQGYKAIINDDVLFNKPLSSDFDEFTFNTPDFEVDEVNLFWTNIPHQDYQLTVQANLKFNYPVDPNKLKSFLEVKNDGNVVNNFQVVSTQTSDIIAINFGEIKQNENKQRFSIKIKKNLLSIFGKKPLANDRIFESELPPITKLVITDVTSGIEGEIGWIEIFTTQKVDENDVNKFITIKPKLKYETFINDNNIRLELEMNNTQTVDLLVKEGLPGLYGGKLESDFEQQISLVNVNPSLKFNDQTGIY